MKVIADVCIVPIGVGVSVSKEVAVCERIFADAGLATAAVWVVRRTRIRVQRFPRFGDLSHQDRRRVQVPVGVRDVRVAEISAQGDDMAGDRLPVIPTLLQRADSERAPQIVDARSWLTGLSPQTN